MDEQGLGGAANSGAPHLGVDRELQRLVGIRRPVDIDMHDALEMGEHRDPRLALHPVDQALSAAGHDDVERAVQAAQHLADRLARGEGRARDRGLRQARGLEAVGEAGMDRGRRVKTVRSAAQHHSVAALEAERAGVGGDIRPALVDDADDAKRRRHPFDDEAVGAGERRQHPTDRIGQVRDLLEPARDRLDATGIESEPVDQGRAQVLRAGRPEIEPIGGENSGGALTQEPRRGVKRAVLFLRRRVGELARRGARLAPDVAHRGADVGFGLFDLNGGGHEAPRRYPNDLMQRGSKNHPSGPDPLKAGHSRPFQPMITSRSAFRATRETTGRASNETIDPGILIVERIHAQSPSWRRDRDRRAVRRIRRRPCPAARQRLELWLQLGEQRGRAPMLHSGRRGDQHRDLASSLCGLQRGRRNLLLRRYKRRSGLRVGGNSRARQCGEPGAGHPRRSGGRPRQHGANVEAARHP